MEQLGHHGADAAEEVRPCARAEALQSERSRDLMGHGGAAARQTDEMACGCCAGWNGTRWPHTLPLIPSLSPICTWLRCSTSTHVSCASGSEAPAEGSEAAAQRAWDGDLGQGLQRLCVLGPYPAAVRHQIPPCMDPGQLHCKHPDNARLFANTVAALALAAAAGVRSRQCSSSTGAPPPYFTCQPHLRRPPPLRRWRLWQLPACGRGSWA